MTEQPRAIIAVVPVNNERFYLPGCLEHLSRSMDHLQEVFPQVQVGSVLVFDRCTDGSTEYFERHYGQNPRFHHLTGHFGTVGAARLAGVRAALQRSGTTPRHTWIACTDADSKVPSHWLESFIRMAHHEARAVLGTVEPTPGELDTPTYQAWHANYRAVPGHDHVHGANMAFNAQLYLQCGGFEPVAAHEDRKLAERFRNSGARLVATAVAPVQTSGRLTGRLHEGFADYLADLHDRQQLLDGTA